MVLLDKFPLLVVAAAAGQVERTRDGDDFLLLDAELSDEQLQDVQILDPIL